MDIFDVLSLAGGLAFFLYGMNVMSVGLEKLAGGKLEGILRSMTSSPVKGMVFGALVTAVIQSSSAVTVMLVGLVNSSIMSLQQSVSIIMGANIGTTITAWLLSLVGIESSSFLM
ncbi:MAG: Na/Pi symporter, partial [Oscillospiraceae bacterium]|nr:Na/Pi symporter [Oscillospiraceae bacterium]